MFAIPCGLIVNELVTNCLKYAFVDQPEGKIEVSLRRVEAGLELQVRDDGLGLGDQSGSRQTLGMTLVEDLTEQLDGTMNIRSEDGTVFTLTFRQQDGAGR